MDHMPWEGFSAWDLIMPLFLFIVGAAMPYSFARRIEAGASKGALYRKVFLRTLILFVLGMAAQGHLLAADLSQLHIYSNTLQAIACGYLIASIALIHLRVFAAGSAGHLAAGGLLAAHGPGSRARLRCRPVGRESEPGKVH